MLIRTTKSLCPECLKYLDAEIFSKNGKVFIIKVCPEHGEFHDLYYGDYELYKKIMSWQHDGENIQNPNTEFTTCPESCGICNMHKSHTSLANIVVTNRCDLKCFYCFFYADAMGYVYEPSLPQIRQMLRNLRAEQPIATRAIQLTGGEPTLREDIVEIIKICKEEGFRHVQLNTDGIRISHDIELAKLVRSAGMKTLYLSFDGTTSQTNPKNHYEIPQLFENCRQADIGVVLVPTIIKNINDNDAGNIVKFAAKHIDIVRGINFQPVSLVGRLTKAEREKMRITIPDIIQKIEEQTNGEITKDDWYPVPIVTAISHFVQAVANYPQYEFTAHPVCGMATYAFKLNGKIIPITKFVDVKGLMEYLNEKADEIIQGKNKLLIGAEMLFKLNSFIDKDKQPKDLNFANILFRVLKDRDYSALDTFHKKSLFLGMMHFQDLYNYDIERTKRCCVHYAQPDGTIIPFCSFNVIPQWYRDKIQKHFSISIEEWEKQNHPLEQDLYKRDIEKLKNSELYKKTY